MGVQRLHKALWTLVLQRPKRSGDLCALTAPSKSHKFRLVSKLSIRNYDFSRGAKQFKNYKSFSTLASRAAGGIAPTA